MPTPATTRLRSPGYAAGLALTALILAGCAQQGAPGYYDVGHESTQSDARKQAQGRTGARAPAQLQLGFGENAKADSAAAAAEGPAPASRSRTTIARPLAEPKTYLGTMPCLAADPACPASRVTLTLAPSGEWRARTLYLDGAPASPKNTLVEQGCWSITGTGPLRILLQLKNENTKANLSFVNDNVLRVNLINDVKPTLDYHLTRQPDIDAISELDGQPALRCDSSDVEVDEPQPRQ